MVFGIEFNNEEEMPQQIQYYFTQLGSLSSADEEYIAGKAGRIIHRRGELDRLLNDKTTGWKTSRMNKVDLTILRLAVYEILMDEEVPEKVAINEAVELAKKYSGADGPSFINGVLAKFA